MSQPRTAVVVVHGIGEQRPLETLRGFVGQKDGGILDETDIAHTFFNAETLTGLTYSRRISLDHTHLLKPIDVPSEVKHRQYARVTHFYEYYWAYRFRSTLWRHLPSALLRILRSDRAGLADGAVKGRLTIGVFAWRVAAALASVAVSVLVAYVVLGVIEDWQRVWPLAAGAGASALLAVFCAERGGLLSTARVATGLPFVAVAGAFAGYAASGINDSQFDWLGTIPERYALVMLLVWLVVSGVGIWVYFRKSFAGVALILVGIVPLGAIVSQMPLIAVDFVRDLQAVAAVVLAIIPAIVGGFALKSLGDAARYLSNSPEDISEREEIRKGLVNLIDRLHHEREPVTGRYLYDRIVIVGHSLGSVIAYDALAASWARVNTSIYFPDRNADEDAYPLESILHTLETTAPHLVPPAQDIVPVEEKREEVSHADNAPTNPEEGWRLHQRRLQAALRPEVRWADGRLWRPQNRWIVSDFISLGSPLAHADILLADGLEDLRRLSSDRLLATCPPAKQVSEEAALRHPFRFREWRGRSYCTKLHHAALFAVTSWTNIYFTHDLVGGPLKDRLGPGIDDVHLEGRSAGFWSFLRAFPHTSYWNGRRNSRNKPGTAESIQKLRGVILRQYPSIIVSGSVHQVKQFRDLLIQQDMLGGPPRPDVAPQIELRILRTSEREPARAWTWVGTDPWYPIDAGERLVRIAQRAGLDVSVSDGTPPTSSSAVELPIELPHDKDVELDESAAQPPAQNSAEPDNE